MPDNPTLPTVRDIVKLIKLRKGISKARLNGMLGYKQGWGNTGLDMWCKRNLWSPRLFDKLFLLMQMAGFSDAEAAAIYAQWQIPERKAHLRKYVGCTVRRYRKVKKPISPELAAYVDSIPYSRPD